MRPEQCRTDICMENQSRCVFREYAGWMESAERLDNTPERYGTKVYESSVRVVEPECVKKTKASGGKSELEGDGEEVYVWQIKSVNDLQSAMDLKLTHRRSGIGVASMNAGLLHVVSDSSTGFALPIQRSSNTFMMVQIQSPGAKAYASASELPSVGDESVNMLLIQMCTDVMCPQFLTGDRAASQLHSARSYSWKSVFVFTVLQEN
ncbi:hypothetical protein L210DRAFT_933222 [Boletus edulis BED1]|uniref:Uncharacterized protein n=1 Tax=Boletus edulis BED1 TaxID=1328754 RepID=A0AAD4BZJ5_BOLED|nr:hypothetical protein L210DRAFT_933222 [Boletus edulis BED1]